MKKTMPLQWLILCVLLLPVVCPSCKRDKTVTPPAPEYFTYYGLTNDNKLVRCNENGNVDTKISIQTIGNNEQLLEMDFRPATGQLYAISNANLLYTINHLDGTTVLISKTPFNVEGNIIGFDFNPVTDRIRILTDKGHTIRLNPETGNIETTDPAVNTGNTTVKAIAHTDNWAGTTTTTLYDIDTRESKLYQHETATGKLLLVGPLTIAATAVSGFDISPDGKYAAAILTVNNKMALYRIDLHTAKAVALADTHIPVWKDIAIPTNPVAYAVDKDNNLLIFNPEHPVITSIRISGLANDENICGIDFRPSTGQLYALSNKARLYTLNIATANATIVGVLPVLGLQISQTADAGFNFNPSTDRIRVINSDGQNMRLHPATGNLLKSDIRLSNKIRIAAVAYAANHTDNKPPVLYDVGKDKLYRQVPEEEGKLVEVGPLGITLGTGNGFDIGTTTGKAYGIFNATTGDYSGNTFSKIYTVNLNTGAVTAIADFPGSIRGFALGLGF
ncbi:DUF4394 domain-containing protein [Chitinophaga pendula]|uniref:DUF4394 domain-containing protein n=1 Tax=Chitinophaga TaxID=79328 RepID=UPI000BAF359E|nr:MULTISPECIES: DUF4394 domain-containing protein [Chitinophaga]ASZ12314.1 hypothetical protein CK934_15770 [Chitinophaga sp. MD30]UCJ10094.1 DUF4394 domain-containing protein [Chitinophaga pendula]